MKKIQATLTFCLLLSSSAIVAKKPVLRVETIKIVSNDTSHEQDPNTSARISGCKEALDNYTQKLEKLSESPLGSSERTLIGLIIADAQQMKNIVTPTSPEMGQLFAALISSAIDLYNKKYN
jgi:hypothetical protein